MAAWVKLGSGTILLVWLAELGWQAWALSLKSGAGLTGAHYSAFVIVCGFLLLATHLVVNILRPVLAEGDDEQEEVAPPDIDMRVRFAAFVATWIAYVVLLPVVGFLVATFAAMVMSMLVLGRTKPLWVILGCALFTVTLKVLFITVFYISLPSGLLDELIIELVFDITS